MININLSLINPFSDRWDMLWYRHGLVSQYKAWELNGYRTHYLIELSLRLNIRGDHAGVNLELGLFGYSIELALYDTRHWDYENNCWELHVDHKDQP
jgi:hypothetical protein